MNVYGHFLASSSSFQPRKACKLDIDPSYHTVQMFREVGKEKIMLACLDTNNTVTIINNKKTVEMVVEQCEYFSTGFTCAWFITADGMAKSYGADPGNNNLPHLRDNGKIRMVCTAGWDTIVVYQDDSFTLAGQKWDSDPHIYLKREDPSLLNPVEKVVFDSWSVIGSICGTMWDTDFSMTEVEPGVWKSDPLELKAEDQLKVRANNDWTNNYGLDGDHSLIQINEKHGIVQDGLNIIIETDGVYVVILDFNTNTIAITE